MGRSSSSGQPCAASEQRGNSVDRMDNFLRPPLCSSGSSPHGLKVTTTVASTRFSPLSLHSFFSSHLPLPTSASTMAPLAQKARRRPPPRPCKHVPRPVHERPPLAALGDTRSLGIQHTGPLVSSDLVSRVKGPPSLRVMAVVQPQQFGALHLLRRSLAYAARLC